MKTIEYKGKTLTSDLCQDISDELFQSLREEYYRKPPFKDVKAELQGLLMGNIKVSAITKYYVKDLMAKVYVAGSKWSIEDVFNSKELLGYFYGKVNNYEFYTNIDKSLFNKIETALSMGGKGITRKATNFPIKTVDFILKKYNVNNNYYDYSCGWGTRLLGAIKNKLNYFGTDPNYELTERLKQIYTDYKKANGPFRAYPIVDIRTQGSEHFVSEWEGKMGVAFSSPPYFALEDYVVGEQSYKEGVTYQQWLDNYMKPTIQNCYRYLISGGYFIINIKDYWDYTLEADCCAIAKSIGLQFLGTEVLENNTRVGGAIDYVLDETYNMVETTAIDNNETIYVFKKV